MALNPATMAVGIKNALVAAGAVDGPATAALALGIATAVVTEIVTNAVVLPTLLVWPGGLAPLPVTGTATVT